ncbi:glucose-1-phosphate thymidylyltransferase [candidate division WWE3 bacterium CG_4_9_14_3_um_filter_41_6]|nr:MAG: glucose-1-phosphate thymidylyltransferase [candidate division WWE3 bacterium CG_4_9_14_3_um_filter_41_6]
MKAIIPIGGRGTRMRPVTFSANKHFIPVANKLLIEYPLETVAQAGITDIAITYNPGQLEYAQKILGTGERWDVKITYVLQEKPLGLANIFQVCEQWVGDSSFVLHLGDNIFTNGIKRFVDHFETQKPMGLVSMLRHPENRRMGVPYFNSEGRLERYVEKPAHPPHDYAIPGLYFLDHRVFECFRGPNAIKPSQRGEYEIPDAFQWLIDNGLRVDVLEYKGVWLDPGKFDDWLDANRYLLDQTVVHNIESTIGSTVKLEGRVEIGTECTIEHSTIRGPVRIGKNVTIKNSFLGPYTSISDNCSIENVHIENSLVMQGSELTNIAKVVDTSLIGPDCMVSGGVHGGQKTSLFVGELSKIQL